MLSCCRRRLKMAAGLETRNLGTLLAQLRDWQIAPDFVAGPINPSGLLMKPSPEGRGSASNRKPGMRNQTYCSSFWDFLI